MGLGLDSTVFGVSVCKASNGIHLILPSGAAAKEFHSSVKQWDDHRNKNLQGNIQNIWSAVAVTCWTIKTTAHSGSITRQALVVQNSRSTYANVLLRTLLILWLNLL